MVIRAMSYPSARGLVEDPFHASLQVACIPSSEARTRYSAKLGRDHAPGVNQRNLLATIELDSGQCIAWNLNLWSRETNALGFSYY